MYFTGILTPLRVLRLDWILELHVDMSFATTYGSVQLHTYGSTAMWAAFYLACKTALALQKSTALSYTPFFLAALQMS